MTNSSSNSTIDKCRDNAYRLLANRLHSRWELQNKLSKKFPRQIINQVLDELEHYGYLNDRQFAEQFIQWRAKTGGIKKITAELYKRGISKEIIDETFAEIDNDFLKEQEATIRRLAEQKWNLIRDKSDLKKARAKVFRSLALRQFPLDQIFKIIEEICQD